MKCRAGIRDTVSDDNAVVVFHYLLYNREADTGTREHAARMEPLKCLEDLVTVVLRKADAIVSDTDVMIFVSTVQYLTWNVRAFDKLLLDHNMRWAARLGKFDGVRKQVEK